MARRLRRMVAALPIGAVGGSVACSSAQPSLQRELDNLRSQEASMRAQWLEDERQGLRKLPPRAWPLNQPKVDEIPELRASLLRERCPPANLPMSQACETLTFDLATALVFNSVDAHSGLASYQGLSENGHVDGMVARGVCLTEGLGADRDEPTGLSWLRRAVDLGSAQGAYELGTLYLTGGAELEEDESAAFKLFELAAAQEHAAAMFMVADCLLDGVGCGPNADKSRAVPLLFAAAKKGHRGARQYMRQLWDGTWRSYG